MMPIHLMNVKFFKKKGFVSYSSAEILRLTSSSQDSPLSILPTIHTHYPRLLTLIVSSHLSIHLFKWHTKLWEDILPARVKVGVLHSVQQPGSYWDRSPA